MLPPLHLMFLVSFQTCVAFEQRLFIPVALRFIEPSLLFSVLELIVFQHTRHLILDFVKLKAGLKLDSVFLHEPFRFPQFNVR
jgi:hypothetical protein